jgi:hypothetical protein
MKKTNSATEADDEPAKRRPTVAELLLAKDEVRLRVLEASGAYMRAVPYVHNAREARIAELEASIASVHEDDWDFMMIEPSGAGLRLYDYRTGAEVPADQATLAEMYALAT